MDARPVYWILCGAGATLLTSAWGSKMAGQAPQAQTESVAVVLAQAPAVAQAAPGNNSLTKRVPWIEPKADPFSRLPLPASGQNVAPFAVKASLPQIPSFPYMFIGKLMAGEKNTVFLSKNNQVYSIAEGDVLEGVYRVERLGSDNLEVTYLPERKKLTLAFDALAAKPAVRTTTMLSQAETATGNPASSQRPPQGMTNEASSENNGQAANDQKQVQPATASSQGGMAATMGATPSMGAIPSSQGDVANMMGAAPPPQGDALKMMGATPPPQGDVLKMMGAAPPPQGDALKMMGATPPPQGDALQFMGATPAPSGSATPAVP